MRLAGLQPVVRASGPFASACVDVSRQKESADRELRLRWKAVADQLRSDGASEPLIDRVAERVLEPTHHGGALSRYVLATDDEVLIDTVAPRDADQPDEGTFGPLPHLMPLIRLRASTTPYVLVTVDHTGADIVCADTDGLSSSWWRTEGDHDVVHKVPGGGWSQRRYQSRVEDSWERNAEQVVRDLDKIVADHPREPVFMTGDPYARSVVQTQATGRIADRLIDLGHGSRARGSAEQPVEERIRDELADRRARARTRLLDRYRERAEQSGGVAMNVDEVVRALREGSLETLLLVDRPDYGAKSLWAGPHPRQLARTVDELSDLGVDVGFEDQVDEVLVRALADVDGDLHLVEPTDVLHDGVGGLLRFDSGEVRPE